MDTGGPWYRHCRLVYACRSLRVDGVDIRISRHRSAVVSVAAGYEEGPHRPVRWHFGSDRMQSYVGKGCACVPSCAGTPGIHAIHRARDGQGTPASKTHSQTNASSAAKTGFTPPNGKGSGRERGGKDGE